MKKKILVYCILCLSLVVTNSCKQGTLSANNPRPFMTSENKENARQEKSKKQENTTRYTNSTRQESTLLRADPRFINWLEKESLYRHAPDLIGIVTGTSLAWRASSSTPQKANILASSPAWFYAHPRHMYKRNNATHFGEFLQSKSPQSLKKMGIGALYFSPTAAYSLDTQLHLDVLNNGQKSIQNITPNDAENAIISYAFAESIGSKTEYQRIEQIPMIIGGDMLEPAIGIGPDFLLALRAVREYPGLFMMTELPQELWEQFPEAQKEKIQTQHTTRQSYHESQTKHSTAFSPHILSKSEKEILIQQGIIPPFFARDFFPDANEHGFALTNPIRGFDSAERRWVYRYAKTPYKPLLNMADPSLSAHKLFTASIIQQIGILHQPLIGVSIADLWGQESFHASQEQNKITDFASEQFSAQALFTLELWNKSIHNYGSWAFVRDAFPMEYIPLLLAKNSDFVADTIFMPALEKSFLAGNATAMKKDVQNAMDLNIPFSSLWHGSADTYQKEFLMDFFSMPSSMSLASHVVKITEQEAKLIQKMLTMPDAMQNEKQLLAKYKNAKKIQFAHIAFPTLLPGLNFISGHDIRGTIASDNNLPQYSLTKNSIATTNIMLNKNLDSQRADRNSLLSKLKPIYAYRQENRLGEAKILAILKTKDEVFGVLMQAPTKKYYITIINTSAKNINTQVNIPYKQKNFTNISNTLKPLAIHPTNNSFPLDLQAWEVRCFELK